MHCWGDNAHASRTMSADDAPRPTRTHPVRVEGIVGAVDIAVSKSTGCAVTEAGQLYCWNDLTAALMDARKPPLGLRAEATKVTDATSVHAAPAIEICVVHRDETASCFNDFSELPWERTKPLDGLSSVAMIAPGDTRSCVRKRGGDLLCWTGVPAEGATMLTDVTDVDAGSAFVCATTNGFAYCWGRNDSGQVRTTPGKDVVLEPTKVPGLAGVRQVQAGVYHACAIVEGGRVRCWGSNRYGQLGPAPGEDVPGLAGAIDLAVGQMHTCAALDGGEVRCWGRNRRGQLGDGTTEDRAAPLSVGSPR